MNTEELKGLIELFANVNEGAYTLILVYISKIFIEMILGYACLVFAIFAASKIIQVIIKNVSLGHRIKETMGYVGDLTTGNKDRIIETIKAGMEAQEKKAPKCP